MTKVFPRVIFAAGALAGLQVNVADEKVKVKVRIGRDVFEYAFDFNRGVYDRLKTLLATLSMRSFVLMVNNKSIYSGILVDQNAETVTVITNPESPRPQVVAREDIESLKKSPLSMMPKGLLDRYTKDEIYEILSYVVSPKE